MKTNLHRIFLTLLLISAAAFHNAYANSLFKYGPPDKHFRETILDGRPFVKQGPGENFILTIKTKKEVPPVKVTLRALPKPEKFRYSMGFDSFREKQPAVNNIHTVKLDTEYFQRAYGSYPETGRDIVYNIEIYHPELCSAVYYEDVFRVYLKEGKYMLMPAISDGPFVTKVTQNSTELDLTVNEPAYVQIDCNGKIYGTTQKANRHKIKITDLKPGEKYKYSVLVNNLKYFQSAFQTAPEGKIQKFAFAFMGDSRSGEGFGQESFSGHNRAALSEALRTAQINKAEFILFTGDLITGYSSDRTTMEIQYEQFKKTLRQIGHCIPFYPAIGNHELWGDAYPVVKDGKEYNLMVNKDGSDSSESLFADEFNNFESTFPAPEKDRGKAGPSYRGTVYSFDYGSCHFTVLNTDYWFRRVLPFDSDLFSALFTEFGGNRNGYIMDSQLKWLDEDLAKARLRGIKYLFVMQHQPIFPNSSHIQDSMYWGIRNNGKWSGLNDKSIFRGDIGDMREKYLTILSKHGVKAVLCSHEHGYNRMKIDSELSPNVKNTIWQITSAGAGAPYTLQNKTLPWSAKVEKYSPNYNIVIFKVKEGKMSLTALTPSLEVMDKVKEF